MDVLLICNFWHFEFEKQSSRYRTMAEVLVRDGHFDLEVISSTFRHQTKMQRDMTQIKQIKAPYKVTLLPEPSYSQNISVKRIWAHHCLAKRIVKYLQERKRPDVIICSVPSLSVGSAVTKFAVKNNVKVIVDIQDLWPEAYKMALNIPILSDVLFFPMMVQANRIYQRADRISAVSETYVNRGLYNNKKASDGLSLYIGTDSKLVAQSIQGCHVEKNPNEFWVGYVGALGHSYDICSVIDAISILNQKGIRNIVFKVMGEGTLMEHFQQYAAEKKVKCDFTGFLAYGEMMATLMACDVAVNPIVGTSVSSIINKVSDYAMAGIPVINTQNSPEYRALIERYGCGINCKNGNAQDIANAIHRLYCDEHLKESMGVSSKKLADEKFDRSKTYVHMVELIKGMKE